MNVLSSPRTAACGATAPAPTKRLIEQLAMLFGVGTPFLGLLAAMWLSRGWGISWLDLLLLGGFYCFSILGVTIGYHRMFTHRALESGPALRLILAIAGSMSAQGSVLEWCAVHRQHHKHSDRDGDPHSPHCNGGGIGGMLRGMVHAHFGWLFKSGSATSPQVVADLLADPVLVFADRFFWLWMLVGWVLPGVIGGAISGSWIGVLTGVLWGGLARTFLLHHVTWSINSVCHVWGTRPFRGPDESRNNFLFGLLAFGEGWHNNHHAFPTSARHGLRWWEIDITYNLIRLLEMLGLVWNIRVPARSAIRVRRGSLGAGSNRGRAVPQDA